MNNWLRFCVFTFCVTLMATVAIGQSRPPRAPVRPQLTAEQTADLQARSREIRRRAGSESARIRGATSGVSVGLRCAEGYVQAQRITPSTGDVQIVATSRTDCDGSRCRGLQVTAQRPEGSFDLDVEITCSGG